MAEVGHEQQVPRLVRQAVADVRAQLVDGVQRQELGARAREDLGAGHDGERLVHQT